MTLLDKLRKPFVALSLVAALASPVFGQEIPQDEISYYQSQHGYLRHNLVTGEIAEDNSREARFGEPEATNPSKTKRFFWDRDENDNLGFYFEELNTGEIKRLPNPPYKKNYSWTAWTNDDKIIVTPNNRGRLSLRKWGLNDGMCIINTESNELINLNPLHEGYIRSAELSPDRKYLAFITIEGRDSHEYWQRLYIYDIVHDEIKWEEKFHGLIEERIGTGMMGPFHNLVDEWYLNISWDKGGERIIFSGLQVNENKQRIGAGSCYEVYGLPRDVNGMLRKIRPKNIPQLDIFIINKDGTGLENVTNTPCKNEYNPKF